MSNFAPIWLNFNGGEVSPKVFSRVDHEKYPSWCETVSNFILTPQGMASKRPGTIFTGRCEEADFASELIPFEYSNDENFILEFGRTHIRFYTNDGLVLESTGAGAGTVTATTTISKNSHGWSVDDYIYLSGMSASNHNGKVVKITSRNTNDFTFSGDALDVSSGAVNVAKVYRIAHGYTSTDLANLQFVQSGNTVYLFHESYQPKTLVRTANDNWAIANFNLKNGPWLEINSGATTLSLNGSGDLGRKAGVTVTSSGGTAANAVDGDPGAGDCIVATTAGWVKLDLGAGNTARLRGYILSAGNNRPATRGPGVWRIQGSNDNVTWTTLRVDHATEAWVTSEMKFYPLQITPAYRYFRLYCDASWSVDSADGNAIGWWGLLADPDAGGSTLTLTASNTTDINNGNGFTANDVGRAIRLLSSRGYWVWGKITAYTSNLVVSIQLQDFPFGDDYGMITSFQLGYFAPATRWPDAGDFFQNRLAVTGGEPVKLMASETDVYANFQSTDQSGVAVDSDAINVAATTRKGDGAVWLCSTPRGIAIGTKSGEWLIGSASTNKVVASSNIAANEETKYGSTVGIRPVNTGNAVLFIDKTGRCLREFAYVYDVDGFRAPNLNLLADHIFEGSACVGLAYQAAPHSLVWAVRADGTLRAISYNRENDIVGWHTHALAGTGAAVRKMATVTNTVGDADDLYMVVARTINGSPVHYIERLAPTFREETAQADAFFVDCGATYSGSAATVIGNLWFLEGATVNALADGIIYRDLTVTGGAVTIPAAASTVTVGYEYESVIKTLPVRGGAMDGTAHGRTKRHYQIVFDFWRTYGGAFGPDEDTLEDVVFLDPFTGTPGAATPLFTGFKGPFPWPGGHEKPGAVCYVHSDPTPCNIRAFMPRQNLTDA